MGLNVFSNIMVQVNQAKVSLEWTKPSLYDILSFSHQGLTCILVFLCTSFVKNSWSLNCLSL